MGTITTQKNKWNSYLKKPQFFILYSHMRQKYDRSQLPRGLRRKSAAARLLGLRGSHPAGVVDICLLELLCCARTGLCDEVFPRPEESCRVCTCVSLLSIRCDNVIYTYKDEVRLKKRGRNISSWCSQSAMVKFARVNAFFKRTLFLLIER
jgi:hypothetical protein